jgi:hypothetical protein
VFLRGRKKLRRNLKLKSEERKGEHKCKDTKNDDMHNGTICNANSSMNNANNGIRN